MSDIFSVDLNPLWFLVLGNGSHFLKKANASNAVVDPLSDVSSVAILNTLLNFFSSA